MKMLVALQCLPHLISTMLACVESQFLFYQHIAMKPESFTIPVQMWVLT